MAPRADDSIRDKTGAAFDQVKYERPPQKYKYVQIIQILVIHVVGGYALFKLHQMKLWTILYSIVLTVMGVLGITAGAHRLWTHHSYKATWPLRAFLVFCYSFCNHVSIYHWVQLHRVHHKYADTEADPHNAQRGFFYAHLGWFMLDTTPEYKEKKKEVDMSDALRDPFVRYQKRFYLYTVYAMWFLPSLVPIYVWGEDPYLSFLAAGALRSLIVMHCVVSINSYAHIYGTRPYNRNIQPTETSLVSILALGEGWHNYHHTFPWDYKAGEFGDKLNFTARFLDLCAKLGLAYDLKTASPEMITKVMEKNGDGSHIH